jgi:hypothetical protein
MDMVEYTTQEDRLTRTMRTPNTLNHRNQSLQGWPRHPVTSASGSPIFDEPYAATSLIEFNYRDYGVSTKLRDRIEFASPDWWFWCI